MWIRGTIFVDGQAIDSVQRDSLRKNFGMVLQDTWLFAGTVKENIAYGKEGATEEEIINAARLRLHTRLYQAFAERL